MDGDSGNQGYDELTCVRSDESDKCSRCQFLLAEQVELIVYSRSKAVGLCVCAFTS